MKQILRVVFLFVLVLAVFGAVEAKQTGIATINLRACLDENGDEICESVVDGATVCFHYKGEAERCFFTEDGEYWEDSKPTGPYFARGEAPEGYHLVGITCSGTDLSNQPIPNVCKVKGNQVMFKVRKDTNAVIVYFLLARN